MTPPDTPPPWLQLEQQAARAFREWPLWLVLRLRELDLRLTPSQQPPTTHPKETP